ncbi:GNAT family N-acetyltransferase [Serratia sp. PAMC26656]|uniref:GNAT family N-acetyltransferase n=1 Tax=Serratia sp. PAMC26656 TaxID=2775909 RepID=UPI0018F3C8F2|nr:GNAT family N-acetyltransferase [Serratia sp. PAMC26656]MBJ7892551.1 GNAT family N-acetyltransferase [Serratia sp. PAMC26656]
MFFRKILRHISVFKMRFFNPQKHNAKKCIGDLSFSVNMYDRLLRMKVMRNGQELGYLNFTRNDGESIYLADIFIFDGYRNLGVGTRLLHAGIEQVKMLNIERIYGVMVGDVDRLRSFYQSFGFELSGKNIELVIKKSKL